MSAAQEVKGKVNRSVGLAQGEAAQCGGTFEGRRQEVMNSQALLLGCLCVAMGACATPGTQVVTGTVRPAISPTEVKIYSHPPPIFEEVAMLDASSHSVFGTGGQKSIDTVIERLKEQAAKVGANGVILEGFRDSQSGAIGAGGGSDSYSRSSAMGVGVGGSLGIYKKTGQGEAIFVPTESITSPPAAPTP